MKYYPHIDREDLPEDAYGPGYLVHRINSDLEDLIAFIGYDRAQEEMAEVLLRARALRRRFHHV